MRALHTPPPIARVLSADGVNLATYDFAPAHAHGDAPGVVHSAAPDAAPDAPVNAPVVLAVHGFASGALSNWQATGWVRDLTRSGYRVIAIDQRGHGESDKPHSPDAYTMEILVADVLSVLDAYLLDEVAYLGYSLGARVGWHSSLAFPTRISRAILGGIPDGDPLTRFRLDQAHDQIDNGIAATDPLTKAYLTMAGHIPDNDLSALVALVEGMRGSTQPDPANPPLQPLFFATGSDDSILEKSRGLAASTPNAEFFEIPGRNHFNAPTSREFRAAGLAFLDAGRGVSR